MKDSGVGWLGDMPEHWEVKRGKALFHCVDVRSSTGEEELLTVSSEHGVVPRSSATVTMFKAESYVGYKLCWPGDLVINSLWAWGRGLGISRHHGIISSAYGVYRLRSSYTEYSAYVHELVRSAPFNWELQVRSKGIWISRLQLTDEAFLGAPFPLPPSQEQAAIVRFLDHADRSIRRYIRAQHKLITLLEEQKQALIHQAVTGQVDVRTGQPYPAYKPSGVEWLGDVPEHWDVLSLCAVATHKSVTGQQHRELLSVYLDRGVIRFSEMQEKRTNVTSADLTKYQAVDPGDFVLNNQQAWRGSVGVSSLSGIVSPAYLVLALSGRLHTDFANLLFRDRAMVDQYLICSRGVGSIQRNLYWPHLKRVTFPSSPISEQATIVRFLDEAAADIAAAIDRARRQIVLWREYRTRLIADVVTGKLDVRSVAARLPDEIKEPEPLDQADPLIDGEEEPIKAATTREAAV